MVRICLYVCMHVCTHIKRSLQAVAKWLNKGKYIHHTLTQVNRRELTQSRMFVCVCACVQTCTGALARARAFKTSLFEIN